VLSSVQDILGDYSKKTYCVDPAETLSLARHVDSYRRLLSAAADAGVDVDSTLPSGTRSACGFFTECDAMRSQCMKRYVQANSRSAPFFLRACAA
jgi:hypothetical protein